MQRLANLTLTFLLILTGIAIFAAVEADSEKPEARATTLAEITATDWLPTADARKIGGYWLVVPPESDPIAHMWVADDPGVGLFFKSMGDRLAEAQKQVQADPYVGVSGRMR